MAFYKKTTFLLITTLVGSISLLAQTTDHPLNEIQANKTLLQQKIQKIDSLTYVKEAMPLKTDSISTNEVVAPNKSVIKTVYEGSKNLNETRSQEFAGKEEVVVIGKGNFKNILYSDILTNKVIKISHINTMQYMYEIGEDEKSNTERIEITIYYENERPFYAVLKEDHYKNKDELFFFNQYNLQVTSLHKDMYFTNDFQKTIYKYIQDLSDSVMKQK